ncbi:MAG: hypothetical protein IJM76_04395 [Lachnospiraceae bacterium]|nr:hypothetical protein [Lachnospiraceae bacterium]
MNRKRKNRKLPYSKRLAILYLVIGLLLCLCIGRAIVLVLKNGDEYRHRALQQSTASSSVILAQPGNILDANGTALAVSKRVYRLILDPKVLFDTEKSHKGSMEATVALVAKAFQLDEADLRKSFEENEKISYLRYAGSDVLSEESVEAYRKAAADYETERKANNQKNPAAQNDARIAGIWFEEEYRRDYPLGDVLSKTVGYTTRDASEGVTGLELYYSDTLHGTNGKSLSYVAEDGTVQNEVVSPEDGLTIRTSLDANVSRFVREAIREFQEEIGGERINVLVMDPNTGEIISMDSDTEFNLNDPSNISGLFTEEELEEPAETFLLKEAFKGRMDQLDGMTKEQQLRALIQQVQMNYCVSGTYEPGSTGKTLTLAGGIEEGVIDKDETFNCTGEIEVRGHLIHCHMGTCGDLVPMEALGRSCNVCFVKIGHQVGAEIFAKYQEVFNLGQKTGIDLPGEANTANLIYYEKGLGDIELATCSFGQGYNVTMVQLASAYASIVNGGYYYEPHVVTELLDSQGNTVKKIEPTLVRRTISYETSAYLKEALRYVTTHGTATTAPEEGYTLGGKTGASEKLPRGTEKYVVSFIGAAPIENPKVLVFAAVDEPHAEDQSVSYPAQVLVHKVMERLYSYFNIYPEDDPDAYTYDWSKLKNFSGITDEARAASFIDDPDAVDWLREDGEREEEE